MPTTATIPVGTVDEYTGLTYSYQIDPSTIHRFRFRTDTQVEKIKSSDVYVDWGDGTIQHISENAGYKDDGDGEFIYFMEHDYKDSMFDENGNPVTKKPFIVTITGKDYWNFSNTEYSSSGWQKNDNKYLISRILEDDLPLAKNIVSLANTAEYAHRLLRVNLATGLDLFDHVHNASLLFSDCSNLVEATNFSDKKFQFVRDVCCMFRNCTNLTTCDYILPADLHLGGHADVFNNCEKLSVDISKLIPKSGFSNKCVNLKNTFLNCKALKGTIPVNLLWDDTTKIWTSTDCFKGSSLEAKAPKSWGGSNTEIVPMQDVAKTKKTVKTINELFEIVKQLAKNYNWNIEISEELN